MFIFIGLILLVIVGHGIWFRKLTLFYKEWKASEPAKNNKIWVNMWRTNLILFAIAYGLAIPLILNVSLWSYFHVTTDLLKKSFLMVFGYLPLPEKNIKDPEYGTGLLFAYTSETIILWGVPALAIFGGIASWLWVKIHPILGLILFAVPLFITIAVLTFSFWK